MPVLPENGYIQLVRITDDLGNPARVSQIAGVWRLAVDALIAAGGPFIVETDNDAIPAAQDVLLALTMGQVYDGTTWRRVAGGTDNAAAGVAAGRTGQFIAGIARTALAAYTDGDVVIPTFDTAGRMMVNMGGIATEDDDDSIAAGGAHETILPLNYGYDGTNWRRQTVKSASAATSDERLMHLSTMAVLAMIDTTAPAGSMEIPLAADRNIGAAAVATGYYLMARAATMGYDAGAAAGSRSVPVEARTPGTTPLDERLYGLYSLAFVRALDLSGAAGSQGVGIGAVGSTSVSASSLESAYGLAVVQARESGYAAAKRGKRFYATNQSIYSYGTLLTAQTAFVTTTPTLLMRCNSAAIRSVIRQINLAIGNTPGGTVYIAVHLDTTDRYASGGVLSTPQNTNEESATAAVLQVYENPVTSLVGATARPLCSTLAPATAGTTIQIAFADGVLLGHTAASLLIYVWAASTAPQILWTSEHEEIT